MADETNDDLDLDRAMDFGGDAEFVSAGPQAAAMSATAAGPQDAAAMDQVRELLLGPLAVEWKTKMTQLSQRMDGSMLELDRRTSDRVRELESRFKDGMDAMVAELAELKEEQSSMMQQVRDELEEGTRSLSEKLETFSDRLAAERKSEIQAIRKELELLSSSIGSRLDSEAAALRSELVDRDSLSAALSEVAMRLTAPTEMFVADVNQPDLDLEAAIEAAARNS